MELREYLAIRRAYNLVRQDMLADRRLTFVELAILCRMDVLGRPMNTSEITEYQGALRPTMTHRTKHLSEPSKRYLRDQRRGQGVRGADLQADL